jgi:small subunit ribosomal protein S6
MLKTYEITYLTPQEETLEAHTVAPVLAEHGAKILSVHPWGGRRKLAYPIKKEDQAFYTTIVFELEPDQVGPIEGALRLKQEVLRSIVVHFVPGMFHRAPATEESTTRTDETTAPATEAKVETTPEVVTTEEIPTVTPETAGPVVAEAEKEAPAAEPKKRRTTKKTTEVDQKALDEKLDALLNEDITK